LEARARAEGRRVAIEISRISGVNDRFCRLPWTRTLYYFDLARIKQSQIAIEAVERIDALFAIECEINGKSPSERVRNERSRPLVTALEAWLRAQRRKLSNDNDVRRHNWTFAGSDKGGRRAAAIYTLLETCKLNDVDPQAWLADILSRRPDHPARRIDELLPWNWKRAREQKAAA
jgi:transposase